MAEAAVKCPHCQSEAVVKYGKASNGKERFRCQQRVECGRTFVRSYAALAVVSAPQEFKNGRHFAAFLGLVPRQHSSGGKAKLLGISKRGNSYLRRILVSGAQSILRWSPRRTDALGRWVTALRQKKPWNVVAVALANKNARVIWHLLRYDVDYCPHAVVA